MTDLDLWRQLRAGNQNALERIYREHIVLLLQYGGKFAVDAALVEDCIQDLFIDLWQKRENLSDTDSIRAYLLVSLRRRIIRQLERRQKFQPDADPAEIEFLAEPAIDQQLLETEIGQEKAERLQEAMKQLSERQKEILYLKYYTGLDYEAIGQIMELNYQSARNLVSRALIRLKELMTLILLIIFWKICTGW